MRRNSATFLALVLALGACGCKPSPERNFLSEATAQIQRQEWDAAIPLLKQHIEDRPEDAAAHFYLGRCYLLGSTIHPGPAEGEFRTALKLFSRDGRRSPIAEYSDTYFELRCHLEIAKVYLRLLEKALSTGAPAAVVAGIMGSCQQTLDDARRVDPDSDDVRQLEEILDGVTTPTPPPAPPTQREDLLTT